MVGRVCRFGFTTNPIFEFTIVSYSKLRSATYTHVPYASTNTQSKLSTCASPRTARVHARAKININAGARAHAVILHGHHVLYAANAHNYFVFWYNVHARVACLHPTSLAADDGIPVHYDERARYG